MTSIINQVGSLVTTRKMSAAPLKLHAEPLWTKASKILLKFNKKSRYEKISISPKLTSTHSDVQFCLGLLGSQKLEECRTANA